MKLTLALCSGSNVDGMTREQLLSHSSIFVNIFVKFCICWRFFLIEEYCRFLSNFSSSTADVELPGEYLTPRHSHYSVKIARFMPRVEIVHKHNTAARRLYIRGGNGKVGLHLSKTVVLSVTQFLLLHVEIHRLRCIIFSWVLWNISTL